MTQHQIKTIRSSENLFAMDVAGPEPASSEDSSNDSDKMVCHVDFVKLLQSAARLKKLLEFTAPYGDKKTSRGNHQANAHEIIDAVVGLYEEFLERRKRNAPVVLRNVDDTIDATIDQCLAILKKETDWCVEIVKEKKQAQQKKIQESSQPKESSPARPVTPLNQVETPEQEMNVPQHLEVDNDDEWERMVGVISDSFEGPQEALNQVAVCPDEKDPLVTVANNLSDGVNKNENITDVEAMDCDDISIVTCSPEQEEDPLFWFVEYWGAAEQRQDNNEPLQSNDSFLMPAEADEEIMFL